jgi:hypothetical protein
MKNTISTTLDLGLPYRDENFSLPTARIFREEILQIWASPVCYDLGWAKTEHSIAGLAWPLL